MKYRIRKSKCCATKHLAVGEYLDTDGGSYWGPYKSVNDAFQQADYYMKNMGGCGCDIEVVEG